MNRRILLCLALLAATPLAAFAGIAAPAPTSSPSAAPAAVAAIDPAKRALITQLLQVMRTEQESDALASAILSQSPDIVQQIFPPQQGLTPDQQAAADKETERLQARFTELFKQNVDIPAIVRSVTFDLYDKYFTADEIKDLIAFYKTPTGQKAVDILPQLSQESMKMTDDALAPKIKAVVQQLQDEEAQRAKASVDGGTSPAGAAAK